MTEKELFSEINLNSLSEMINNISEESDDDLKCTLMYLDFF